MSANRFSIIFIKIISNDILCSYRIEKAIAVNMLKNEIVMYREIKHAVDIHRKAIKLVIF